LDRLLGDRQSLCHEDTWAGTAASTNTQNPARAQPIFLEAESTAHQAPGDTAMGDISGGIRAQPSESYVSENNTSVGIGLTQRKCHSDDGKHTASTGWKCTDKEQI
jgi:hypothetical protein